MLRIVEPKNAFIKKPAEIGFFRKILLRNLKSKLFKSLFFVSAILSGIIYSSCEFINPDEPIPSYIYVDSIGFTNNYDSFGSSARQIKDAWVIVDNEYIGAFELPATIPVLKTGSHNVIIKPGIIENGVSNTRVPYPFYTNCVSNVNLTAGKVDSLKPVSRYVTGSKFCFKLDFEIPDYLFVKADNSNTDYTYSDFDPFEGSYSMMASLKNKKDYFEAKTMYKYILPRSKACFLELNFKTDEILHVGYYSINTSNSVKHTLISLNPTQTWKKVYVNVGTELLYETTDRAFTFFVAFSKTTDADSSVAQIDNFKLIYFE